MPVDRISGRPVRLNLEEGGIGQPYGGNPVSDRFEPLDEVDRRFVPARSEPVDRAPAPMLDENFVLLDAKFHAVTAVQIAHRALPRRIPHLVPTLASASETSPRRTSHLQPHRSGASRY